MRSWVEVVKGGKDNNHDIRLHRNMPKCYCKSSMKGSYRGGGKLNRWWRKTQSVADARTVVLIVIVSATISTASALLLTIPLIRSNEATDKSLAKEIFDLRLEVLDLKASLQAR